MRKKLFHTIFSASLAIVMLLPLSGIYINLHRCGGELISIGLYTSATKCKTDADLICSFNHNRSNLKKTCCSEESIYKKLPVVKVSSLTNWKTCSFFKPLPYRQDQNTLRTRIIKFKRAQVNSPPGKYYSRAQLQVFII